MLNNGVKYRWWDLVCATYCTFVLQPQTESHVCVCVCVCVCVRVRTCVARARACVCARARAHTHTYRVFQEECARLREGVPYVKVYQYNPKHLCPKLNGYGDNGQRKVWSSGRSTHSTCQLTSLIDVCPWVWCLIQLTLAVQLCSRLIPECAVSHVTSVLAIRVSCIVLGTLRTNMTCVRVFFFVVQFNGFVSLTS